MTPDEARSLGRAIKNARADAGLTQSKLAFAIGISVGHLGHLEKGRVPAARGREAHAPTISRTQLVAIATALGCTVEAIADRAALSATTRVLYGLEPLGPSRTRVGGRDYDLTDAEADRVADFIAGIIAARDLH